MATLTELLTKLRARLSSLNTKTGRSDTDLDTAINALPSKKTSDNVTVSGATVTTPAGIYFSQVQKSVATASRATTLLTSEKSNNTLVFTANNPQTTGYVTANTSKDTATKTVSLSVSGGTVTASDGTNSIAKTVATGSAKTPATTITKNPTILVDSSGLITASVSGTQSVTPTVSAGYVSSGTAGTITVSGSTTKQLTLRTKSDLTASNLTVTAPAGYYHTAAAKTLNDSNLIASNIKSGVSIFGVTGTYEGSSSGASLSACTMTFDISCLGAFSPNDVIIGYTATDGTTISNEYSINYGEMTTLSNVLCGSTVTLITSQPIGVDEIAGDSTCIYNGYRGCMFRAPLNAGDEVDITFYEDT